MKITEDIEKINEQINVAYDELRRLIIIREITNKLKNHRNIKKWTYTNYIGGNKIEIKDGCIHIWTPLPMQTEVFVALVKKYFPDLEYDPKAWERYFGMNSDQIKFEKVLGAERKIGEGDF